MGIREVLGCVMQCDSCNEKQGKEVAECSQGEVLFVSVRGVH